MTTEYWGRQRGGRLVRCGGLVSGSVPTATDGAVIVAVSAPIDDYPASTAPTGVVAIGSSATGDIGTTGDANWFKVTLTAGTAYQFDLQGGQSGEGTLEYPTLSLLNGSGDDGYPASTIGDIGTTGDANRFKVTLAAGTTYQGSRSGQGTLQRPILSLLDSDGDGLIDDIGDGDGASGSTGSNARRPRSTRFSRS